MFFCFSKFCHTCFSHIPCWTCCHQRTKSCCASRLDPSIANGPDAGWSSLRAWGRIFFWMPSRSCQLSATFRLKNTFASWGKLNSLVKLQLSRKGLQQRSDFLKLGSSNTHRFWRSRRGTWSVYWNSSCQALTRKRMPLPTAEKKLRTYCVPSTQATWAMLVMLEKNSWKDCTEEHCNGGPKDLTTSWTSNFTGNLLDGPLACWWCKGWKRNITWSMLLGLFRFISGLVKSFFLVCLTCKLETDPR